MIDISIMVLLWVFEYEINNTSFTSTQWNAIQFRGVLSLLLLSSSKCPPQPNTSITGGIHTKIMTLKD